MQNSITLYNISTYKKLDINNFNSIDDSKIIKKWTFWILAFFLVVFVVVFYLHGNICLLFTYVKTSHKCSQLLLVRIFLTLYFEIIVDTKEVANTKHIVPCTLTSLSSMVTSYTTIVLNNIKTRKLMLVQNCLVH